MCCDSTTPLKLHSHWKNLFHEWTAVIFTAVTLCDAATLILRPLWQYSLPAILVHGKHWYSFKKISLPFSGLHSHTFRKLFEPTNLSFSNLLFLYTHRVLSNSASNHTRQKIHNHQRSQEYTKTHSTTTRDVSGEQDTVPRNAEQGAFVLTAKWI